MREAKWSNPTPHIEVSLLCPLVHIEQITVHSERGVSQNQRLAVVRQNQSEAGVPEHQVIHFPNRVEWGLCGEPLRAVQTVRKKTNLWNLCFLFCDVTKPTTHCSFPALNSHKHGYCSPSRSGGTNWKYPLSIHARCEHDDLKNKRATNFYFNVWLQPVIRNVPFEK